MITAESQQYASLKQVIFFSLKNDLIFQTKALGLNQTMLNSFVFYNALMDNGGDLFIGFTNNMFVKQNTK